MVWEEGKKQDYYQNPMAWATYYESLGLIDSAAGAKLKNLYNNDRTSMSGSRPWLMEAKVKPRVYYCEYIYMSYSF